MAAGERHLRRSDTTGRGLSRFLKLRRLRQYRGPRDGHPEHAARRRGWVEWRVRRGQRYVDGHPTRRRGCCASWRGTPRLVSDADQGSSTNQREPDRAARILLDDEWEPRPRSGDQRSGQRPNPHRGQDRNWRRHRESRRGRGRLWFSLLAERPAGPTRDTH